MAERYPLKGLFDGGGAATDLAEFAAGDFVGLSSGGLGFTSVAGGDLLVGAVGGASLAKLPIGAAATVLTVSGGAPAWSLITNANISPSAAIDWTKMNGSLPSSQIPNPLILARAASGAADASLIIDQLSAGNGAAMSWRRNGAVRANAYLETSTDELVFRNVTGAAGSEVYSEALRLYKAGQGISAFNVNARTQVGSDGYMAMHSAGGANTGYVEWYRPGPARIGYMGYGSGTSWLNMQLENGVGFQVTASDPAASSAFQVGFDPAVNYKPHVSILRSSATVPEWIAFRTGAVAYDMFIGREANRDRLSIARWNGAGDPVEFAHFDPSTVSLTVIGNYLTRKGIRIEGVYDGAGMAGAGAGVEMSVVGGSGYLQGYNRTTATATPMEIQGNLVRLTALGVVHEFNTGGMVTPGSVLTSGIFRSTGTAGTISGGPGAEMYWSGAASVYQSYDRTAGTYQPVIISGSNTTFYAGGAPKLTVEPGGGLVTAVPFKIWSASATDANLRFYTDDHYAVVRHGAGAADVVMIQNATGNNVATMSSNVGMTFETTNAASWGYTFQQNSTTGYGMRIWSKNDGLPAFAILNAAQTAWALQVQGTGNVLVGAGVTSPTVHARSLGDATYGYVEASQGGPSNAGYIAWHKPGPTRLGYMGFDTANSITLNLESSSYFRVFGGHVVLWYGSNLRLGDALANQVDALSIDGAGNPEIFGGVAATGRVVKLANNHVRPTTGYTGVGNDVMMRGGNYIFGNNGTSGGAGYRMIRYDPGWNAVELGDQTNSTGLNIMYGFAGGGGSITPTFGTAPGGVTAAQKGWLQVRVAGTLYNVPLW